MKTILAAIGAACTACFAAVFAVAYARDRKRRATHTKGAAA